MYWVKTYAAGTLGLKQDLAKAKQHLERASAAKFDDASIDLAILLFSENTTASNKAGLAKAATADQQRQYAGHSCQSLI